MQTVREILLVVAVISLGILLGASVYESVVLAPNFRAGIPDSLEHFRLFMKVANPGTFFRTVAPIVELSLLASIALNWTSRRRWWIVAALIAVALGDIITFVFHYPRNALLFREPLNVSPQVLEQTAAEWANGNYVRVALVAVAMILSIRALLIERRAN